MRKRRDFKYYVVYRNYAVEFWFLVINFRFAVKRKQTRKILFIIKGGKSEGIF